MATTYTPIYATTLTSAAPSISLSNFPSTYSELVIVLNSTTSVFDRSIRMQFNSDTGTNYSYVNLVGYSGGAITQRQGSYASLAIGSSSDTSGSNIYTVRLPGYANTTSYKTYIARGNAAGTASSVDSHTGTWRGSTGSAFQAITSITLFPSSGNFNAGTTVALYGIASTSALATVKATGGDSIVTSGGYTYHVFRSSGTFTPSQSISADVLCIAGGGGGGNIGSGSGGAGGLQGFTSQSLTATGYTITVGAGGGAGANGGNSQFASLTASVGGGAGGAQPTGTPPNNGNSGGSGGGGAGGWQTTTGGAGTSGQGNRGGNGTVSFSGGGGGAGAAGGDANRTGGIGSNAYATWATATLTGEQGYYAGGGSTVASVLGGGGGSNRANAVANTGGGGAGDGGLGGSGIVIVRYAV